MPKPNSKRPKALSKKSLEKCADEAMKEQRKLMATPNNKKVGWREEFDELKPFYSLPVSILKVEGIDYEGRRYVGQEISNELKSFIQAQITKASIEGYAQGRLRCLQHHCPKELENAKKDERQRCVWEIESGIKHYHFGWKDPLIKKEILKYIAHLKNKVSKEV